MLIACPNCATSYNIEPASLGAAGRTVRCARCKTTWFASGLEPAPEMTTSANDALADGEAHRPVGVIRPDEPVAGASTNPSRRSGKCHGRYANNDPRPQKHRTGTCGHRRCAVCGAADRAPARACCNRQFGTR